MSTVILIFLLVVCVLVLLSTLAFMVFMMHDQIMVRGAPFVPIPKAVLEGIITTFNISPGDVVYDLGCGDGRVLKALAQACPEARFVGVDKGFIPYFFATLNTRQLKNLTIKRGDFFQTDLSDATHVFVYLFPRLMDLLLPKFEQELKSGAVVISADFRFANKNPDSTVSLGRPTNVLGRELIVYKF